MDTQTQKVIDLLREVLAAVQPDKEAACALKEKIEAVRLKLCKLTNLSKDQNDIINKLTKENKNQSKEIIKLNNKIEKVTANLLNQRRVNNDLKEESDKYFGMVQDLHSKLLP
jgi:hypothetical protein